MAFEKLTLSANLELCEGLTVYLVEPNLGDSSVISQFASKQEDADYGLIASDGVRVGCLRLEWRLWVNAAP